MRLIDADALQTALVDAYSGIAGYKTREKFYRAIEIVRRQPTIIPSPNEQMLQKGLREMDGGGVYSLQKVAGGVGNKVLCAECGRRRYGGTYTLDGKRTKESQT